MRDNSGQFYLSQSPASCSPLCMCSSMVPSMLAIFQAFSELQGVAQYQELTDLELLKMGAFVAAEMTPQLFASAITMPDDSGAERRLDHSGSSMSNAVGRKKGVEEQRAVAESVNPRDKD